MECQQRVLGCFGDLANSLRQGYQQNSAVLVGGITIGVLNTAHFHGNLKVPPKK